MKTMPSLSTLARRSRAHFTQRRRAASFSAELETAPRDDLFELGDLNYGGYVLPSSLIDQKSVCYLAGTGEDVSFDLGLIARFGCTVHSLDPVPRAAQHVAAAAAFEPRLVFHSAALWSSDQTLTFHAPRENGYVSQSAINLHGTEPDFTAPARAVSSLMAELGHDHIDVLKVSAEGSEYEIVDHIVAAAIDVRVLCVEYAQPAPVERVRQSIRDLESSGYTLAAASVRTWNWKLTFIGPRAGDGKRAATLDHRQSSSARRGGRYHGRPRGLAPRAGVSPPSA
jgi:FkbM family methyltransferase